MGVINLNYNYDSGTQGWVGIDLTGNGSTSSWSNLNGNPSSGGCLKIDLTNGGSYAWVLSSTWTALGVPSNATVTGIQLSAVDTLGQLPSGGTMFFGASLRSSSGGFVTALCTNRTVNFTDSTWTDMSGSSQDPSPYAAPASSIKIYLVAGMSTSPDIEGSHPFAFFDNLVLQIQYTLPGNPSYNGGTSLTHQHQTIISAVGSSVKHFYGSANLSHSHHALTDVGFFKKRFVGSAGPLQSRQTLSSSGNFIPRYSSSCYLTHSNQVVVPTLVTDGGLDEKGLDLSPLDKGVKNFIEGNVFLVYREYYRADIAVSHSSQSLSLITTYLEPIYSGIANLNQNSFLLNSTASNPSGPIFGHASLTHGHMNILASAYIRHIVLGSLNLFIRGAGAAALATNINDNISLFTYGDSISQDRPHGSASFLSNYMNLYINGSTTSSSLSPTIGNGNLNLYVNGVSNFIANQITLYLCNNTQLLQGKTTLFISGFGLNPGFIPIGSSMNMYINGGGSNITFPGSVNNSATLYVNGIISSANSIYNSTTLFIQVDNSTSNNYISLYISGKATDILSNSITLTIPKVSVVNTIPLYIHGF